MAENQSGIAKVYAVVRDSLKGVEHDYTSGSISLAVVLLAVPMIMELSLESVFAIVDIFFVSRLGEGAIATVGLTESVISLVYSLAMGLSTAATAVVARRIGEKRANDAAHAGAQAILLAICASVIISIVGIFFGADILRLMGAEESVVKSGAVFTKIEFGGSMAIMLLFLINGIFRGAGNPAMAMKSLWIASGVNIILCPILIHFFGLKGAAIATVTGRTSGVVYQVIHLAASSGRLSLKRHHFKWDYLVMQSIVKIAWPAIFQFIIASGSWILIARLVTETGGTPAAAGYQIAMRNVVFFILPAWGLSNAAATLVGQNLGAKEISRAEQSVRLTAVYNTCFMAAVTLIFMLFAEPIIRFYTPDPAVMVYGVKALRIVGSGFIFYGIGMVFTQALNGAGDSRTPTLINLICFWVIQIPLGFYLARNTPLQTTGAFISIPVAESLIAVLGLLYFRLGKWKMVKV